MFGQLETGNSEQILIVPTTGVVFEDNRNWVVKKSSPEAIRIEVQVINETESVATIRPVHLGEIKSGDQVAVSGAIFFFKK